jgi:hypothetical protein
MGIVIGLLGLSFLSALAVPEFLLLICIVEYRKLVREPAPALQPAVIRAPAYFKPSPVTFG